MCIIVYAYNRLSLARAARDVGLASGSRRGLVSLFRRGTWGCWGRHRSRSCARFARWGVLLGVVGRGSVMMLCAHAHTHRMPLLAFPVGASSVLSCLVSHACLRYVGYARAALCGPLVASRPPGDLKNTTNPHQIALGPPPHFVWPSWGRVSVSFQKRARGGRSPDRFYLATVVVLLLLLMCIARSRGWCMPLVRGSAVCDTRKKVTPIYRELGGPRETQGNPRKPKETQGNPRKPKETQGNPREPKTKKGCWVSLCFLCFLLLSVWLWLLFPPPPARH